MNGPTVSFKLCPGIMISLYWARNRNTPLSGAPAASQTKEKWTTAPGKQGLEKDTIKIIEFAIPYP